VKSLQSLGNIIEVEQASQIKLELTVEGKVVKSTWEC